jgi:hypothetical protein
VRAPHETNLTTAGPVLMYPDIEVPIICTEASWQAARASMILV